MLWSKTVDVLCVGSGAAGLSAAITAAQESDLSVLVVEKDDKVGGVTGISSGQLWVGDNSLAAAASIEDSEQDTYKYLNHLSQGLADLDLQKVFVEESKATLDYLVNDIGLALRVVKGYPDYYYPAVEGSKPSGRYLEPIPYAASQLGEWADRCIVTSYGPHYSFTTSQEWVDHQSGTGKMIWECLQEHLESDERCAGAGLAAGMLKACLDRNIDIWLESAATRLISENGRVVGAVVATKDGDQNIRVNKGVVLATGAYDHNVELVTRFESLPGAATMTPPTVEGDHIVMAAEVGAMPYPCRSPGQSPIFIGYKVPGETAYGLPSTRMLIPGWPHSMIVNETGNRFANDSFYPDVVTKVGIFRGQEQGMENWPAWLVFDQNMLNRYGLLPSAPGEPLPDGMAIVADTVEELAKKVGISVTGLSTTVDRFNMMCEDGVDQDFGRGTVPWGALMAGDFSLKNPNMAPLETGPFYAIKIERVNMGTPTAGLKVNENAQVINSRGEPIVGLYAGGNSTAQLDIGGGYNSGIANTRGLVHGRLAALHMVG